MPDLRVGSASVDAIYYGSSEVTAVYYGSERIWPSVLTVRVPVDSMVWSDFAAVIEATPDTGIAGDLGTWTDYAPSILTGVNVAVPVNMMDWRDFEVSSYGFSKGFSSGFTALPSDAGPTLPTSDAMVFTDYAPTIEAESIATREFRGSKSSGNSTSATHTFAACDIGSAVVGRRVFAMVVFYATSSKTVSSATIGGNAAAVHLQHSFSMGGSYYLHVALVSAQVDTGTTGDVVITLNSSAALQLKSCGTYKVLGLQSTTPVDTAVGGWSTAGGAKDLLVDVLAGGLLFDCQMALNGTAGSTYSYTAGATLDADVAINSNHSMVCGSAELTADQTNRTVTMDGTAIFRGTRILASFR